jgi:hypothetical protein
MRRNRFQLSQFPDEGRARLEVLVNRLEVTDLEDFDNACAALVAADQPQLELDIRKLDTIHSGYIGVILYSHVDAADAQKKLIVEAGDKVRELIERMTRGMVELRTPGA